MSHSVTLQWREEAQARSVSCVWVWHCTNVARCDIAEERGSPRSICSVCVLVQCLVCCLMNCLNKTWLISSQDSHYTWTTSSASTCAALPPYLLTHSL